MKIVDSNGDPIPGCFTFTCCGFEISCSTISNPPEVVVFSNMGKDWPKVPYRAASIEDAIAWCEPYRD
jgi:hypothetical protein